MNNERARPAVSLPTAAGLFIVHRSSFQPYNAPSPNKENLPMTGTQVIRAALQNTHGMVGWYLADLSDADLLVRPVPGANHIAWQLGHLIASERNLARQVPGTTYPTFPEGFAERHTKETSTSDAGFFTKAEYLAQLDATRQAT